jgi:hypothetical protein
MRPTYAGRRASASVIGGQPVPMRAVRRARHAIGPVRRVYGRGIDIGPLEVPKDARQATITFAVSQSARCSTALPLLAQAVAARDKLELPHRMDRSTASTGNHDRCCQGQGESGIAQPAI